MQSKNVNTETVPGALVTECMNEGYGVVLFKTINLNFPMVNTLVGFVNSHLLTV